MNKGKLAEIAGLNSRKIDFDVPQSLFDLMEKNNIPHNLMVYSYEKNSYGEMINLGEEFILNSNDIKIDIYKLFEYMNEFEKRMSEFSGEPFYISLNSLIERLHDQGIFEVRKSDVSKIQEYNKNVGILKEEYK